MFNINPDDLFNKTDQLLFCILSELRQLNKSLHPIARDTATKKKPKVRSAKPKKIEQTEIETNIGGVSE